MSENKRYYWLKLKDDFFRDKKIKKLRRIAGGDTFTIIYLKMQLLSLKDEGKLFFDNVEGSFTEEIALEIDEEVENVQVTMAYLLQCGLVEEVAIDEYALPQTMDSIGTETQAAERVRNHRKRVKALQCNTPVTIGNTEIDIELEKEIDIYTSDEVDAVWNYYCDKLKALNKTRKRTDKKLKHIRARLVDFSVDQLKQVMDSVFSNDFMLGKNDRKKAYIDIENFMCNTEKIEMWLDSEPIQKPIPEQREVRVVVRDEI